jgi:hypothetical protein
MRIIGLAVWERSFMVPSIEPQASTRVDGADLRERLGQHHNTRPGGRAALLLKL